jgi:hypothetical protein
MPLLRSDRTPRWLRWATDPLLWFLLGYILGQNGL